MQRRVRINGLARRALDLIGQMNVVLFSTQDIDLVDGAPALRRRYLDLTNSQLDPRYLRSLQHYNRVVLQRNHLLRLIREGRARAAELEFWDHELVDAGSYLIWKRQRSILGLTQRAWAIHSALTAGAEGLRVLYQPSLGLEPEGEWPQEELRGRYIGMLGRMQSREVEAGMSLLGPHRDDLQFLVDGIDMRVYGSRGQQRTIALSLRLAEADFMRQERGDQPILLLDDVLSELDARRRAYLLHNLNPYQQVFITTTDLDRFEAAFLSNASCFKVKGGRVEPLAL